MKNIIHWDHDNTFTYPLVGFFTCRTSKATRRRSEATDGSRHQGNCLGAWKWLNKNMRKSLKQMVFPMFSSKPCLMIIDYWKMIIDYWIWLIIIKLLIVLDYSDCRRVIWSTLNHQTSPPWGRVFVAVFPWAQWQPFRAFFSRAMQRHGGQVYRLDIWERLGFLIP